MRWLDRLERRFGGWSIPQFPLFIVSAQGAIYLLSMVRPAFLDRLTLEPALVWSGEWWRLLTFLFIPPLRLFGSPIFMAFWLYLLYTYAQALENEWGEFRFGVFYLIGAAATALSALFITQSSLTNVPLNTMLFLAFATLYPDFELLLFFILPVKVKWLAWVTWAALAWSFVMRGWETRVALLAAVLSYLIFFGPFWWETAQLRWQTWKNRRRFRDSDR